MPAFTYRLQTPDFIDQEIVDSKGGKVGTIRLRPSGVLWKPANTHKFHCVTLQEFMDWMMSNPKAKITDR
jgi:hypothetical protein